MPQVIKITKKGQPCGGNPGKPPANPEDSFGKKVLSYALANARWAYYGFPSRSDEEQKRILDTICRPCPFFQAKKRGGKCRKCGCGLNLDRGGKLQMATEMCPADPPRWYATAGPLAKKEAEMQEAAAQAQAMQPETRRQRRARERAARSTRRQERQKQKAADRLAMGGVMPDVAPFRVVDDPLAMFDRFNQPIGHALRGMWQDCAAFYVCGGPSLKQHDLSFLKERGIVSLGINNVSGFAPVRAMTFSDPASKFTHNVFFDPALIKFVPRPKLSERIRAKVDGKFQWTAYEVRHCPMVFAYERDGIWDEQKFLTREKATWGVSKKHKENEGKPTILFSFFLGLRLLHYLGVKRVYLLGVDFKMDAQHHYAFDQYRHDGAIGSNNNSYRVATAMLQKLRPHLEAGGLEVFQTNPQSALRVFDYVPLETAIEDCRGLVQREPYDLAQFYEKPQHGPNPAAAPATDDRGDE